MQKFRPDSLSKICLSLLSLTLLSQTVFGYEEDKISYLDSVSSVYMNDIQESAPSILNMNSIDARAIEATLKLDSTPIISNSDSKINLSLRDSDLRQTLRMIADKGGLNIVFDKSVEGKITLDLNNVTINEAFMIIFKSSQLTYVLDGNTINVMTLEAAKNIAYTRQNMTVIPIKYVNSESVAKFLNTNLFSSNIFGLSNKPIVTSNPRMNQLVVFGSMNDVNAIKRILPMLDTKPMVNTFKVNHTTPEEMANTICATMFSVESMQGGSMGSESSDDKITLGGGYIACRDLSENNSGPAGGDLAAFASSPLTIAFFPELGKINTYGGSVEQVEMIKEFIKEHDKKQLMAYVELSVIELNEEGTKTFSNTWDLWTPFISLGFNGESFSIKDEFIMWDSRLPGGYSKSNNKALIYTLDYILKNNNGRVLTNPKIMVTNGKKTTIDMTSDYVKSVTSQVLQSSNSMTAATQKTYDIGSDEGILIEITPFISPDGYVSMNITPEFATEKTKITTKTDPDAEPEIQATLLSRRDLELKNIRIKDGETLVLAGLIKEKETQDTKKVPVLGDLPFVGSFFRASSTVKSREELVIVVTPHIIKDTDEEVINEQVYDL